MINDPTRSAVLYYPRIEFFEDAWLKAALCIWERVYRIVPSSYRPNDSDDVKVALDAGLVVNVNPTDEDLRTTADDYAGFIDGLKFLPDAIDPANREEEVDPTTWPRIHSEKIDARLLRGMHELVGKFVRDGDWLRVHPRVANGYLLFLADRMAKRRCLPKATDCEEMFVAMQYFAQVSEIEDAFPLEGDEACIGLAVNHVLPSGLDHVPMRDILEFRDGSEEGRGAFRESLTEYCRRISAVEDPQRLGELIRDFCSAIAPKQRRLRDDLTRLGREPAQLSLLTALPASIVALRELLDPSSRTLEPIVVGGLIGLTAIGALANATLGALARQNPPESTYLVDLKKHYGSEAGLHLRVPQLSRMMEEFIND